MHTTKMKRYSLLTDALVFSFYWANRNLVTVVIPLFVTLINYFYCVVALEDVVQIYVYGVNLSIIGFSSAPI